MSRAILAWLPTSTIGLCHLFVVYVAWGSTFLAARLALRGGSGFGPCWLAATRGLLAGTVLLGIALLRREPISLNPRVASKLALTGILFWGVGQSAMAWAMQTADSGYAAITVATVPLWIVLLEAARYRRFVWGYSMAGVITGFVGTGLLSLGCTKNQLTVPMRLPQLAILFSAFCWAWGSTIQVEESPTLPVIVSAGYQLLFGGIACLVIALAAGEGFPSPTPQATLACLYLALIGSCVAFGCYLKALRLLPSPVVSSFAYVNPLIAVTLGAIYLGEQVSFGTVVGMLVIFLGVAAVFRASGALLTFTHSARPGAPETVRA